MLKTAEIVAHLSKSQVFRDYEAAFNEATHLPLGLRPHELWQHALHGKKYENPFCALMAKSSRTCAACLQSQQELIEGEPGESTSVMCFAGLCDTAIPVSVGSNVIGFMQTGQVALRKPTEAGFTKITQQLMAWGVKVDLNELQDAYFHSLVLSREQYEAM
ncbi:MAG TPA: PocR ligand-binding domain-containing protein, partial [Candidatus Methylacidiphilales bacterium]